MEPQSQSLIHSIDEKNTKPTPVILIVIVLLIASLLGIGTGYIINTFATSSNGGSKSSPLSSLVGSKDTVVQSAGIKNEETFKDKTEGILREGGIEGEGAFHIERPGGKSQNAYLTSTTVDLSPFVGQKVRVWGKTFQGEKAGWLMDVGYIEVLQ